MKTTLVLNGEPCTVEGSRDAVRQFFADLDAACEDYRRVRDDDSTGESIRVNGADAVRLSRFAADDGDGLDLPSTRPRRFEFATTNPVVQDFGAEPADAAPAYAPNYSGMGYPTFNGGLGGGVEVLTDNEADGGLELPSTRPRRRSDEKSPVTNAADDGDPGEGLDLPSTSPRRPID